MKKILFILLINMIFMWVTARDGMAQAPAPDIEVNLILTTAPPYDRTTLLPPDGEPAPIRMIIELINKGRDLTVDDPVPSDEEKNNVHLDLTFTNVDRTCTTTGLEVKADEKIEIDPLGIERIVVDGKGVDMHRVAIWPGVLDHPDDTDVAHVQIIIPNVYEYYTQLTKGNWVASFFRTFRSYSSSQEIDGILYSPAYPELPLTPAVEFPTAGFIKNINIVTDGDGDGFSCPIALTPPYEASVDCDDDDPDRFPGNPEVCDGKDNDCDGVIPADELDGDGDGFSVCQGDCDDNDSSVFPVPGDLDGDCDVDMVDLYIVIACFGQPLSCNPVADANGDGFINILDISFVVSHFTP